MIFGVSRWFEKDFSKFFIEFSLDDSLSNPTIRHFDKNNNFWDYDLFFISGTKYYYTPGEEYKDFVDIFHVYNAGSLEFKFLGQETSPDVPQPPYVAPEVEPIPGLPKFFLEETNPEVVVDQEFRSKHTEEVDLSDSANMMRFYDTCFSQAVNYDGFRTFLSDVEPVSDSDGGFYKTVVKSDNECFVNFGFPEKISLQEFEEKLENPQELFYSEDNAKDFFWELFEIPTYLEGSSVHVSFKNPFTTYDVDSVPENFKKEIIELENEFESYNMYRYYLNIPDLNNNDSFIELLSSRKVYEKNRQVQSKRYSLKDIFNLPPNKL